MTLGGRVRAVVVNYGGGSMTLECLERLRRTSLPGGQLQIVLVDNASSDGVAGEVRRRWPEIEVRRSSRNLGFAGGCNLGLRDLDGVDAVALVNNDLVVEPGWLAPLHDALATDPRRGAACPKILFAGRYRALDLDAPLVGLGRIDRRRVGVRLSGVRSGGGDDLAAQMVHGFLGPEVGPAGLPFQWTSGPARLHLPTDGAEPTVVRLRLAAPRPGPVVVTAGRARTDLRVTTDDRWYEVEVEGDPFDVVNNVGTVLRPDGYGADRGFLEPDRGQYDDPADVFAWCGAAVLLRTDYLRDVGLFDEVLFLYYEDLELSWRGERAGWTYRYVPGSTVRHIHSATAVAGSPLAQYYNERNHLAVLVRHAPPLQVLGSFARHLLATASYLRRDLLAPIIGGRRPHAGIVLRRLRSGAGAVLLVPVMLRRRLSADRGGRSRAG